MIVRPNDNPDGFCGAPQMVLDARHNDGFNIAYVDGHVKWMQGTKSAAGRWYLPGTQWWP